MVYTRSFTRRRSILRSQKLMTFSQKLLLKKRLTRIRHIIRMEGGIDSKKYDINFLERINSHEHDKHIRFQEKGHVYYVKGKTGFTSVTKFIHSYSKPFNADAVIEKMLASGKNKKYEGMTAAQIKKQWNDNGYESHTMGTAMHYAIECYFNGIGNDSMKGGVLWDGLDKECEQFESFKRVQSEKGLVPYRTEWCVFDEEKKLSGSIDMVFKNSNGGYDIYDWKRSKEIKTSGFDKYSHPVLSMLPDSNYWQYSLQLNTYKYILEKNYGLRIDNLYLVAFHPEQDGMKLHKAPDLQNEIMELVSELPR